MILIGLTSWSDHPSLIKHPQRPIQLDEYAAVFPLVEIDTSFYGIPSEKTVATWINSVPDSFQFIVKANREMTLHPSNQQLNDAERDAIFHEFVERMKPVQATGHLTAVLFQFPPTFRLTHNNLQYLMHIRDLFGGIPVTIEFRNATWFESPIAREVLDYLRDLQFTLVAVDEPQGFPNSVPFRLTSTAAQFQMIRLHGRNVQGWSNPGAEWRKQRTNYRYSTAELTGLADRVKAAAADHIAIIFNNNGGHDAADNALTLQKLLGLQFTGLAQRPPEQIDLF